MLDPTRPRVSEGLRYIYRPANASKYVTGVSRATLDTKNDSLNHPNISPSKIGGGLNT